LEWLVAESPDKRGGAKGDRKKSGTDDAIDAEEAEQQADAPAPAPDVEPRRPRLYGYDPDHWPEQA
jgi:hypothetical protein